VLCSQSHGGDGPSTRSDQPRIPENRTEPLTNPNTSMKRLITRFLLAADTRKMTSPFHNRIRKVCPLVAATLIIPALAISFAVPTLAQEKDAVDPQVIEQLAQIDKKYSEAVNNNDAAAVAALFTEDAVYVTDRGLVYGRQAIEKQYAEWFKGAHASDHIGKGDPNSARFSGMTDILGMTNNVTICGEWSSTWQAPGQKPEHLKGYWSAVDTRVGDVWKIQLLTYNVAPAPAATTASTETK
jgi:uncharacterized protein (TIGR02246 family)